MIDDKIRIKCSKCSTVFRERAERVRNGFQKQCPNCLKLITFDNASEDSNIRRALKSAREVRKGGRRSEASRSQGRRRNLLTLAATKQRWRPCGGADRPAHDSPQIERAPAGFLESGKGYPKT